MVNLNETLNPINSQERVKINENWDIISRAFSSLQNKINILAGGQDVDQLIQRIETAISQAQSATSDTQAALQEVNSALSQLQTLIDNANILDQNVQDAIDLLNQTLNAMVYTGLYSPTTTYQRGNYVRLNKDSYVSLKQNLGVTPSDDGVNWRLVAAGGTDGNGAVSMVNNVQPDAAGNVALAKSDIPGLQMDITNFSNSIESLEQQVTDNYNQLKYEKTSRDIYVNFNTGSDTNGLGTIASPYKTINYALSKINKVIELSNINIKVFPGDYSAEGNIVLRNYFGTALTITAFNGTSDVVVPNDDYIVRNFTMYNCGAIFIQGFKTITNNNYGIYASSCPFVRVIGYKNEVAGSSGLGCTGYSFVWVENSTVSNVNTVVSANQGAKVVTKNWINSNSNLNGIVVDNGAQVHFSDDTIPAATNQNGQMNGGVIFDKNGDLLFSPQFIGATHDLQDATTQTISVVGTPKMIRVRSFVNQTMKKSDGSWAKNGQGCIYVSGENGNSFDGTTWSVVMEDSAGNFTTGTIGNVQKNSFDIVWRKGGSGATGTVRMQFDIIYH